MNINPIQPTSKFNNDSKTSNNSSSIDIDFSDVLSNTRIKTLTPSEANDICWKGILYQINNEPPEDREEDLKLFSYYKKENYTFFICLVYPSFEKLKESLPCFPPATVPGHIRAQFNDYLNELNISAGQKDLLIDYLKDGYCKYHRENPLNTLNTCADLKKLISYLKGYIQNNRKNIGLCYSDDKAANMNIDMCDTIEDFLDKFFNYL